VRLPDKLYGGPGFPLVLASCKLTSTAGRQEAQALLRLLPLQRQAAV